MRPPRHHLSQLAVSLALLTPSLAAAVDADADAATSLLPAATSAAAAAPSSTTISSFKCDALAVSGANYDLSSLKGAHVGILEYETPPTTTRARVRVDLCNGLEREGDVGDEDQCSDSTRICLQLINHREGAEPPDRTIQVVSLWSGGDIAATALGEGGKEGVVLEAESVVKNLKHSISLKLICDAKGADAPSVKSYALNTLNLEWATPAACPRDADGTPATPDAPASSSGGGFFGFLSFIFWLFVFGLAAYFVIGIAYNHQHYGASGWDLVPHRDFWREMPALARDLGGHVFNNVRSSGRNGYSSLG